jgi:hypothetical protein
MPCTIANGRAEVCKDSVGGLKNVYFINYGIDLANVTYHATNTDLITAITGVSTLYKFELKGENSFEQNIVSDRNAGTTYFEQTLSLKLKKQDIATSKNIKTLAYGRPHVVIEDNNGNFFLMGLGQGADVTGGNINGGTKMADMNGYSLTFMAEEKCYANFLNASTQAAMVTLFTSATLVTS